MESFALIEKKCKPVIYPKLLLVLYLFDRTDLIGILYCIFFLFFDQDIHIIQVASRAKLTDITKYKKGLEDVDRPESRLQSEQNTSEDQLELNKQGVASSSGFFGSIIKSMKGSN